MSPNKKYAGIGSRSTPPEVITVMEEIAQRLAENGWLLRSGAADGADSSFERGSPILLYGPK
jgi:predicted Rossmann fold nucleotide-binding protein DprA/Smf involved in DNA uptake